LSSLSFNGLLTLTAMLRGLLLLLVAFSRLLQTPGLLRRLQPEALGLLLIVPLLGIPHLGFLLRPFGCLALPGIVRGLLLASRPFGRLALACLIGGLLPGPFRCLLPLAVLLRSLLLLPGPFCCFLLPPGLFGGLLSAVFPGRVGFGLSAGLFSRLTLRGLLRGRLLSSLSFNGLLTLTDLIRRLLLPDTFRHFLLPFGLLSHLLLPELFGGLLAQPGLFSCLLTASSVGRFLPLPGPIRSLLLLRVAFSRLLQTPGLLGCLQPEPVGLLLFVPLLGFPHLGFLLRPLGCLALPGLVRGLLLACRPFGRLALARLLGGLLPGPFRCLLPLAVLLRSLLLLPGPFCCFLLPPGLFGGLLSTFLPGREGFGLPPGLFSRLTLRGLLLPSREIGGLLLLPGLVGNLLLSGLLSGFSTRSG
jgi:hypothetical protein